MAPDTWRFYTSDIETVLHHTIKSLHMQKSVDQTLLLKELIIPMSGGALTFGRTEDVREAFEALDSLMAEGNFHKVELTFSKTCTNCNNIFETPQGQSFYFPCFVLTRVEVEQTLFVGLGFPEEKKLAKARPILLEHL